jgi:hypothetical protein
VTRPAPTPAAGRERLVRLLLRAYPAAFRAAYGGEVARCVRDARRALGAAPAGDVARFWARVALDLARQAAVERLASVPTGPGSAVGRARAHARGACGVALLLAAAANAAYDAASAENSMGILAALLCGLGAAAGVVLLWPRRPRPSAD